MKGSQFCFLIAIILVSHGMDDWASRAAGFLWALIGAVEFVLERKK